MVIPQFVDIFGMGWTPHTLFVTMTDQSDVRRVTALNLRSLVRHVGNFPSPVDNWAPAHFAACSAIWPPQRVGRLELQ